MAVTVLGSLAQPCWGEAGHLKHRWRVWGALAVSAALGLPSHGVCAFPSTLLRLLCRELSEAGPGWYAPPGPSRAGSRRRRLGPALCARPGPSSSGNRALGERGGPQVGAPPPAPPLVFLGVHRARLLRCAECLFWGAGLWPGPSRRMSTVQTPRSLG